MLNKKKKWKKKKTTKIIMLMAIKPCGKTAQKYLKKHIISFILFDILVAIKDLEQEVN